MALGIGANTAVFSVVNAVLLRPLAYKSPERIVTLSPLSKKSGKSGGSSSAPDFHDWHDQSTAFEAMGYYTNNGPTVAMAGAAAEYAEAASVSPEFFRVFGAEPVVGRLFTPEEWKKTGAIIVSQSYWQKHFGANPNALGQTLDSPFRRESAPVGAQLPRRGTVETGREHSGSAKPADRDRRPAYQGISG
jgi:hypothetical protein